jgi:hypothetical protein
MKSLANIDDKPTAFPDPFNSTTNIKTEIVNYYNQKKDTESFKSRDDSRIFFLRNFNNWVKSVIIQESICRIKVDNKKNQSYALNVLDLGQLRRVSKSSNILALV